MTRTTTWMLAALAVLFGFQAAANATTINFSNVEVALSDPDDKNAMMRAAWTSWATQVYEYNMPFIEIANTDSVAITQYTMSIGDTAYQFSNEYRNKQFTNSFPFEANGEYAVTGFSTPDVAFSTSVADGGDTLVVDFGDGGLQPGEVVRFQVDINPDANAPQAELFANYTEVFFNNGDGPNGENNNSEVTLLFEGASGPVSSFLPDPVIAGDISQFFDAVRPHSVMQQIPLFPDFTINPVPEPSTALLAVVATISLAGRRRTGA